MIAISVASWLMMNAAFARTAAPRNEARTLANRFVSGIHGGSWSGQVVETTRGGSTRVVLRRRSPVARLFGMAAKADVTVTPEGEVKTNEVVPGTLTRAAISIGKSSKVGAILSNKKIRALLSAGAAGFAAQHLGVPYDHALAVALPVTAALLTGAR
jgi:hypothetical protein